MDIKKEKKKLLVLGYARHGKDTAADIICSMSGLKGLSSSLFCCKTVVYPVLKKLYEYQSPEECYADRINHRTEWYDLICEYNKTDKTRLVKAILAESDIYIGLRSQEELQQAIKEKLFDHIFWVDASKRHKIESSDSCTVQSDAETMVVIDNNGSMADLEENILKTLSKLLLI
jgi:galactitol-specific phosphotransferase system IIB component